MECTTKTQGGKKGDEIEKGRKYENRDQIEKLNGDEL